MTKNKPLEESRRFDRIKRLTVIAMFGVDDLYGRLALKGGNALDLFYPVIAGRSSFDIDLSLSDEIPEEENQKIEQGIERSLVATFRGDNYAVFDVRLTRRPPDGTENVPPFWGGYQVEFKVIEAATFDGFRNDLDALRKRARKFTVDISKREYIGAGTRTDLEGATIFLYTPAMIAIEKLRAICQQSPTFRAVFGARSGTARARDFFDIHRIMTLAQVDLGSPENLAIIREVFAAKRVPLKILSEIGEYRATHEADFAGLRDTVKPGTDLRDFGYYFDFVVSLAGRLRHALGDE